MTKKKSKSAGPRISKTEKEKLREMGEELRRKYPKQKPSKVVTCVLCGQKVDRGSMLAHKVGVHGEGTGASTPHMPHNPNQWVQVVPGGLPS